MSADPMVHHPFEIFEAALNDGDETGLREAAGPDGRFCLDRERHDALLVFTMADGFQAGNVFVTGMRRKIVSRLDMPRSFQVRDVHREGREFIVTGCDGQAARGTAWQFAACPRLIREEDGNPAYQDQLAEVFLSTHLLPDPELPAEAFPPIHDPVLGEVTFHSEHYEAQVEYAGKELWVWFDAAGPDKATELLPHARRLVAGFADLHARGLDMIWERCADGTEPPGTREHFASVMQPASLTIFRSGDFEVNFEDHTGTYIEEYYWFSVGYRADTVPVSLCRGA
jgi:hypothetical protein